MGMLQNIKQRRLVQILVAYLAAGWVGVEVVGSLVENEILPGILYTLALIWYLTGIPIAALIGWYHGEKGNQRAPKWEVAVILIVILSLGGFSATQLHTHWLDQKALASAAEGRFDPRRVAVDYFTDASQDGSLRHVADALTEEVIQSLATVRTLDLVSTNGLLPFRGLQAPPDSMAEALEAGTLVRGVVRSTRTGIQADVRLIDGGSGAEYHRASHAFEGDDLVQAAPVLAAEVSRFLRYRLGEEVDIRETRREAANLQVWTLYHQAKKLRKDASQGVHGRLESEPLPLLLEADSLLVVAHRLDPEWVAPVRERADLAYVRSRLAGDSESRLDLAKRAIALGTEALGLERDDAESLATRGTARYWRWLIDPAMDTHDRLELFEAAKADLERAVKKDPSLASAYSTLSHLYYHVDDGGPSAVALAAQRAYEEDAYLDVANEVLWRLHLAALDMGDFNRSVNACETGAKRFPHDPRFSQCQVRLMATPAMEPHVDDAWSLTARADSLTPEHRRPYDAITNQLFVAGVLHRAGMPDSALAVLNRAHQEMRAVEDPGGDLLTIEAAIRSRIGDHRRAVEMLEQYLARNPEHGFDPSEGLAWWWERMEDDPDFQRLVQLGGH